MAEMGDLEGPNYSVVPEHYNGSVTAGTPVTITHSNGTGIRSALIDNPSKGPNANPASVDVLLISFDGGTTWKSLGRGESLSITALFTDLRIDSDNGTINYEVIITG